jgi:hypothetical protein
VFKKKKKKKKKKFVFIMVETTTPTASTTPTTSTVSTPPCQDPNHHLYLHHSDHPRVVLASQSLNGENYQTWSRAIITALSAKNKLGFIDETISQPETSSEDFSHGVIATIW